MDMELAERSRREALSTNPRDSQLAWLKQTSPDAIHLGGESNRGDSSDPQRSHRSSAIEERLSRARQAKIGAASLAAAHRTLGIDRTASAAEVAAAVDEMSREGGEASAAAYHAYSTIAYVRASGEFSKTTTPRGENPPGVVGARRSQQAPVLAARAGAKGSGAGAVDSSPGAADSSTVNKGRWRRAMFSSTAVGRLRSRGAAAEPAALAEEAGPMDVASPSGDELSDDEAGELVRSSTSFTFGT